MTQRRQRPAAAAAVLQQPDRRRARRGSSDAFLAPSTKAASVTDAGPARLLLDRAARLLVVPRPHRAAGGGAGRLPRRSRGGCWTWAAPTGRAWPGCGATTSGSPSTSTRGGSPRARASARRRWRCPSPTDVRRGRGLRRGRALRPRGPGARRAGPGAGARRPAAAVRAGLPVGVVGPRRPGRPPPPLHAAAADRGRRGRPGCGVDGATYGFAGVFPMFAAERLAAPAAAARAAATRLPQVSPTLERVLRGCRAAETRLLPAPRPAVRLVGLPGAAEKP